MAQAVGEGKPLDEKTLDTRAVTAVVEAYQKAPKETKDAFAEMAPPEMKTFLPIVNTMPASAVVKMTPVGLRIMKQLQEKDNPKEEPTAAAPADPTEGSDEHKGSELSSPLLDLEKGQGGPKKPKYQPPVNPDDLVEFIKIYQDLPADCKAAIMTNVPEEQRSMVKPPACMCV